MKFRKPCIHIAGLLCLAVGAIGCVPAAAYDDLLQKHRKTLEINQGLEAKVEAARRSDEAWRAEKQKLDAELRYFKQLSEASRETIDKLKALDADIMQGAEGVGLKIAAPTEAGEGEITVSEGKIRILGEVLFRSGSHELSSKGRATIAKVASMLKSDQFAQYYIRVDGHTDNQPLVRTKDKYQTNWMLGAWRAHSVMKVLLARGIPVGRLFIASFGEFTPPRSVAGQNLGSPAARRKCRRVEIALIAAK